MRKLSLFLLTLQQLASSHDVAIILAGEDQDGKSLHFTEFFTERSESCVYNEDFSVIRHIFDYKAREGDSRLDGVYVERDALFICSYGGHCDFLNSSRSERNSWQPLTRQTDDYEAGGFQSYGIDEWRTDTEVGFVNVGHYFRQDQSTVIAAFIYTREGQTVLEKGSDITELCEDDSLENFIKM